MYVYFVFVYLSCVWIARHIGFDPDASEVDWQVALRFPGKRPFIVVIIETKILLFVMHLVLILVTKSVGWSIKFKLRVILLAVADPWKPAGLTGEGSSFYSFSEPRVLKSYRAIIVQINAQFRKTVDPKSSLAIAICASRFSQISSFYVSHSFVLFKVFISYWEKLKILQ